MPNTADYIARFNRNKLNCAAFNTMAPCSTPTATTSTSLNRNSTVSTVNNQHIDVSLSNNNSSAELIIATNNQANFTLCNKLLCPINCPYLRENIEYKRSITTLDNGHIYIGAPSSSFKLRYISA